MATKLKTDRELFDAWCKKHNKHFSDEVFEVFVWDRTFKKEHKMSPNTSNFFDIIETMVNSKHLLPLLERYQSFKNTNPQVRSLERYQLRYGMEKGQELFDSYCNKQAKSNTFEYKQEKYGWTKEQFDEYNSSRAVTLKNMIKRHGEEEGTKKFEEYCERQAYAGCKLDYFVEKYGKEKGLRVYKELNRKKVTHQNKEYFIKKYGEEEGLKRYAHKFEFLKPQYSKVSQELFEILDDRSFQLREGSYYGSKNREPLFMDEECEFKYYVDFMYDKKIIEFYGDFWHCNPKLFEPDDEIKRFRDGDYVKLTAQDIWLEDKKRIENIENMGYTVLVVWENDFRDDYEAIIEKCLEFLDVERN